MLLRIHEAQGLSWFSLWGQKRSSERGINCWKWGWRGGMRLQTLYGTRFYDQKKTTHDNFTSVTLWSVCHWTRKTDSLKKNRWRTHSNLMRSDKIVMNEDLYSTADNKLNNHIHHSSGFYGELYVIVGTTKNEVAMQCLLVAVSSH